MQINRAEAKSKILTYSWVPVDGLLTLQEVGRRANKPEVLRSIRCPVLLIHSVGDMAASIDASRRAFDQMPSKHKRFVELTRSNHHVYWDFEREQVISEIEDFLGALLATGR